MANLQREYQNRMRDFAVPEELTRKTLRRMREEKKPKRRAVRWTAVAVAAAIVVLSGAGVMAGQVFSGGAARQPSLYAVHLPGNLTNVGKTVQGENLQITLKGVWGDAQNTFLSFEVRSLNGDPLQENSEFRQSTIARSHFEKAVLICDGQEYQVTCLRTDDGSDPAYMTFEGMLDPRETDLSGKEATLVLENLTDDVSFCEDADFMFDNLHELYAQMEPAGEDEFVETGAYATYGDGVVAPSYMLKAGEQKVKFSDQFPNSYIDNIGFFAGGEMLIGDRERQAKWLYVSVTPGNEEEAQGLKNLSLQNVDNYRIMGMEDIRENLLPEQQKASEDYQRKLAMQDGRIILALSVYDDKGDRTERRDTTEDDLYHYRLVKEPSSEDMIRAAGKWEFDFTMDYQGKEKTVKTEVLIPVLDGELPVQEIYLSDYTLRIRGLYKVDFANKVASDTTILFKNGTELKAGNKVEGGTAVQDDWEDPVQGEFRLEWTLTEKIDPDEVAAIRFFGTEIPVN